MTIFSYLTIYKCVLSKTNIFVLFLNLLTFSSKFQINVVRAFFFFAKHDKWPEYWKELCFQTSNNAKRIWSFLHHNTNILTWEELRNQHLAENPQFLITASMLHGTLSTSHTRCCQVTFCHSWHKNVISSATSDDLWPSIFLLIRFQKFSIFRSGDWTEVISTHNPDG